MSNTTYLIIVICLMLCVIALTIDSFLHTSSKSGGATTISFSSSAPPLQFKDLLDAIEWVESEGDPIAVGDDCKAVGAYQMHEIYVDDVNRILREAHLYIYENRWDKDLSRKMVAIYLRYYADLTEPNSWMGWIENAARIHNGGPRGWKSPATEKYWLKIKARMENQ